MSMTAKAAILGFLFIALPSGRPSASAPACETGNPNDRMVQVGSWCVDRYEATICDQSQVGATFDRGCISRTNGNNLGKLGPCDSKDIREGSTDCELQHDAGKSFLGSKISDNGILLDQNYRAFSRPGLEPTAYLTVAQAETACANAGKQVIPDDLWMEAYTGTVDPGSNDGFENHRCNTNSSSPDGARKAGDGLDLSASGAILKTQSCVSNYGVEDMLGNLWEIVRSTKTRTGYAVRGSGWGFGSEAVDDATKSIPDEWPEKAFPHGVGGAVGFRCARKLP